MSQTPSRDSTQTSSGTAAADAELKVALAESLSEGDLQDLCDATGAAIHAGGGELATGQYTRYELEYVVAASRSACVPSVPQ